MEIAALRISIMRRVEEKKNSPSLEEMLLGDGFLMWEIFWTGIVVEYDV